MPKASIIIRSKNEERWIKHCLSMVHAQTMSDFEVILVDNESEDATVEVARRAGIDKLTTISHFRPGLAINRGIAESSGEYLVILSAHCVPRDEHWLEALLQACDAPEVAGAYGRQVPVSFSSDNDKRDLLITFGLDRRVQVRDYFFHNANSVVRREVWERYPFDNDVTNIEDRVWGKEVVSAGYHLVYEPDAAVYHHHGIHQNLDVDRGRSVVSILERVESADDMHGLPDSMKPANVHVTALCPVLGPLERYEGKDLMEDLVADLKSSRFVNSIHLVGEHPSVADAAARLDVGYVRRPGSLMPPDKTVEDVLRFSLQQVERDGELPDAVLYANYLFPHRPAGFFDRLVEELQLGGMDTVFAGEPEYDNFWFADTELGYRMFGSGMKPRAARSPLYRAIGGLGTLSRAFHIRKGVLIGEHVGIVSLPDARFTHKVATTPEPVKG